MTLELKMGLRLNGWGNTWGLLATSGSYFDPRIDHLTAGLTLTLLEIGIQKIPIIQVLQGQERAASFLMQDGPIIWKFKMQTQIAFSTTESEYISLPVALREVIYLQQMIQEMRRQPLEFEET